MHSSLGWFVGLAASAAIAAHAQGVRVHTLGKPRAEHPEALTQVTGVRELRGGRVVVLDRREMSMFLVDFTAGSRTKVGRDGDGPGEYRVPLLLIALPGDSTAMVDMGNLRGNLVITPDGKPGGFLSSTASGNPGSIFDERSATDARGRVYREIRLPSTDSTGIERWDRTSARRDTVAVYSRKVVSPLLRIAAGGARGGGAAAPSRGGRPPPFFAADQWAVAPDGRVAVVSVEPYRVRFVDARGARREGPPLVVDRVPVTPALKAQWREERGRPVPTMVSSGDGKATYGMTRPPVPEPEAWPEELPPFFIGGVSFAPDGMLWVQRTHAADAPPSCDLIDANGRIVARVVLPKRSRVVGFGANAVYLVRIDEDDLEYLQRHRLPGK